MIKAYNATERTIHDFYTRYVVVITRTPGVTDQLFMNVWELFFFRGQTQLKILATVTEDSPTAIFSSR